MGVSIVVTSGKGGTGKTSAVAALGSILGTLGYRTLCVDADVGLRNLDLALGLADRAAWNFMDVIERRCAIEEAACPHPDIENLWLLTAPSLLAAEEIWPTAMRALLEGVKPLYDYCLIDSPAGVGAGFRLAARGADRAVIVTQTDAASLRDAQRVAMELDALGVGDARLLVNRVRPGLMRRLRLTVDDAIDNTGIRLLGIIPEDREVLVSAELGQPLILRSSTGAARAYLRVAKRVLGENAPIERVKSRR